MNEQRSERWISTRKKWNRWIIQGELPWNRVSRGPPAEETEVEDRSSDREAKRARVGPVQGLSGGNTISKCRRDVDKILRSLLCHECDPVWLDFKSGLSGSLLKKWCVKRTYSESTALPNLPAASSDSGVNRAHEKSSGNDDEEQPRIRARISNLITGLHGVDTAEHDEICNGDEILDEWMSSWYPETR